MRQYRFLLRHCTRDSLLGVHIEALAALDPTVRGEVLAALRRAAGTGVHLAPDRVADLSRLLVRAEERQAGVVLAALPTAALQTLATAALETEAAFGLFAGYAEWDGSDPEPVTVQDSGYDPRGWEPGVRHRSGLLGGPTGSVGSRPISGPGGL